jgi:hypothetical protein
MELYDLRKQTIGGPKLFDYDGNWSSFCPAQFADMWSIQIAPFLIAAPDGNGLWLETVSEGVACVAIASR